MLQFMGSFKGQVAWELIIIMLQKYNRLFLYTTSPYSKRQKCIAKQQYILLKQLRNYINGFKKPSKEREQMIINKVNSIGKEYMALA